MEIRPLSKQDYENVALILDEYQEGSDFRMNHQLDTEPNPDDLVAVEMNRAIAYLGGNHSSDSWGNLSKFSHKDPEWNCSFVSKINVHPEYRCQNVGRLLMEEFERVAVERGNDLIILHPMEDDDLERRLRFFRRLGFEFFEPDVGGEPWLVAKELS